MILGIRLHLSEIFLEFDANALQVFLDPLDLYVGIGCAELDSRRRDVADTCCRFLDKGLEHIDPCRNVGRSRANRATVVLCPGPPNVSA